MAGFEGVGEQGCSLLPRAWQDGSEGGAELGVGFSGLSGLSEKVFVEADGIFGEERDY